MELMILENIVSLIKYEAIVEEKSVYDSTEKLVEHVIHCLSCS